MSVLICYFDGNQWNYKIKEHDEIHRNAPVSINSFSKPKMPNSRVIKEGVSVFCIKCNSTASKKGFLGIFGERTCDNDECENSKSNFKKL